MTYRDCFENRSVSKRFLAQIVSEQNGTFCLKTAVHYSLRGLFVVGRQIFNTDCILRKYLCTISKPYASVRCIDITQLKFISRTQRSPIHWEK